MTDASAEKRRRLVARVRGEGVPPRGAAGEPQDQSRGSDDAQPDEQTTKCRWQRRRVRARRELVVVGVACLRNQLLQLLVGLARVGDPQLLTFLADEEQLLRLALVAEAGAVRLLWAAVGTPLDRLRAEGSDEELQFEPERDEERQPDRHRRPEPVRSEQPREHEGEERESEPHRSEHARL